MGGSSAAGSVRSGPATCPGPRGAGAHARRARRRSPRRSRRCGRTRGEPVAGRVSRRERAVAPQLLEDRAVVGRVDDDADVLVVLRRGPHHGRTAHVDELDRRIRRERIEVAHHEVDQADPQRVEHVEVHRASTRSARIPPWTAGWSVLTRPSSISGRPGHLGDLDVVDARRGERLGGAAARDELPPEIGETAGELLEPGLVVDGQQRPHPPTSRGDPRPSTVCPSPARRGTTGWSRGRGCARPTLMRSCSVASVSPGEPGPGRSPAPGRRPSRRSRGGRSSRSPPLPPRARRPPRASPGRPGGARDGC